MSFASEPARVEAYLAGNLSFLRSYAPVISKIPQTVVAEPVPERRPLTILFCDMVASTEYSVNLDPEDFRHLMESYLQSCSSAIRRHGGVVASYIGDAIKGHFGYPIAQEDDAELALSTAIEILEIIPKLAVSYALPLEVRLGIASGEVVVGNVTGAPDGVSTVAFGHVAHLAARLQTLAMPGEILTDNTTYRATDRAFEFIDYGSHSLRGFSEPVHVWRASHARPVTSRFAKRVLPTRFYGRDKEMRLLLEQSKQVSESRSGRLAFITGEPGIGKSRLLHEVVQRLVSRHLFMLQCSETFENTTLYPFISLLKRHSTIDNNDDVEEVTKKLRSTLGAVASDTKLAILLSLLGVHDSSLPSISKVGLERQRKLTKNVFIDWFRYISNKDSIVILFEDAQWADAASRELISSLSDEILSIPALIMVSSRNDGDSTLDRSERGTHVKLRPLDVVASSTLIDELSAASPMTKEITALVMSRAEGIPLFIEELTRAALDNIRLAPTPMSNRRSSSDNIPDSLQSSLLSRLDKLGPAKEIAQIAATIGRDFNVDLLQAVSGVTGDFLQRALDDLVMSGLINRRTELAEPIFSFRHVLLQQAAQGTLLRERRQHLHGQIAGQMEALDPAASSAYPELLAQHFADAALFGRSADYWMLAGTKAAKTWAKADAARFFEKGLEVVGMLPDSEDRSRRQLLLELERGDVLYATYGYITPQGTKAYHNAMVLSAQLGDPEAPIRALDGLFGTYFNSGRYADSIGASDRLIEIGKRRGNLKALVLGLQFKGMSVFCQGRLTSAQRYLQRALQYKENAEEVGSDFPSMAMLYLAWTMHILGYPAEALKLFDEAELITRSQSPYRLTACLGNGCILFAFRNDHRKVVQLIDEIMPIANENGFNLWINMARIFKGWAQALADGSPAGIELMREALVGIGDQEADKACYLGLLASALLQTGRYELALEAVLQGLEQAYKINEHYYTAILLVIRGQVELALNADLEAARAFFSQAIQFSRRQGARSWEFEATRNLTQLLRNQGREDEAARRSRSIENWFAKQQSGPSTL